MDVSMQKWKKVAVTGSCGFIGFHLANMLSDLEIEVHCIDNFSNSKFDKDYEQLLSKDNVVGHNLDLTTDNLTGLGKDFDVIFHLAAKNGTSNFYEEPLNVLKSAIEPTLKLLEYFNEFHGVFLLASTSENYAGGINRFDYLIPTPEEVPLIIEDIQNLRWSYAAGKIASESAVIAASKQNNLKYIIARIHNVYGPRMGYNHFIPDYMSRILKGEFKVFGPEQTRSFLYIDDACRLLIDLAETESSLYQIVNVGSDIELTVGDVALMINQIAGLEIQPIEYPAPSGSVARRVPDVTKLKSLVEHYNLTTIDRGLKKTLAYYKGLTK
jgi:nucleoside-diphosphate-sugar epimerase